MIFILRVGKSEDFIPKKLRDETLEYLKEENKQTGFLFLNRFGERITTRGISLQLKKSSKNME